MREISMLLQFAITFRKLEYQVRKWLLRDVFKWTKWKWTKLSAMLRRMSKIILLKLCDNSSAKIVFYSCVIFLIYNYIPIFCTYFKTYIIFIIYIKCSLLITPKYLHLCNKSIIYEYQANLLSRIYVYHSFSFFCIFQIKIKGNICFQFKTLKF